VKVMIMAGGTGGHVYPGLAIANELRGRGHDIVWMGAPDSFEARVVPQHDIPMELIQVQGLRGKGIRKLLNAPSLLTRAVAQAHAALRRQQPAVVLGMGGFAAGPGGLAAKLYGVPLVIHEQNAVAGLTNRVLAKFATSVLEAFPNTFAGARTVGNPVRSGFVELSSPAKRFAARRGRLHLLVLGGSQGARALNEKVPQALARMAPETRPMVRHQAGRTLEIAQTAYATAGVAAEISTFIDDMTSAYAWADLVVCRAGASTIAELAAAGCASLLVPFPHAVDDHQTRNGEYLVNAGAAKLVQEAELDADGLAHRLRELLADRHALIEMAEAARRAAWPTATATIADACLAAGAETC